MAAIAYAPSNARRPNLALGELSECEFYGRYPSISMNNNQVIVEVHSAPLLGLSRPLFYRVGKFDQGEINWGTIKQMGTGYNPKVSITDGGAVMVVYQNNLFEIGGCQCLYRLGQISDDSTDVHWKQAYVIDGDGSGPTVAITDKDSAVVLIFTKKSIVNCLHGTRNGAFVDWKGTCELGEGKNVAVSMTEDGTIVEMHTSLYMEKMQYRVGKLTEEGDRRLVWGAEFGRSQDFKTGSSPSIALNADKQLVEVHESVFFRRLHYQIGAVTCSEREKSIEWRKQKSNRYTYGCCPAVAMNDQRDVVEIHETGLSYRGNTLWSYTGKLLE